METEVKEGKCLLAEVFAVRDWCTGAVTRDGAGSSGLDVFAGIVDARLLAPFEVLMANEDIDDECGGESGLGTGEIVLFGLRSLSTTFEAKRTFLLLLR